MTTGQLHVLRPPMEKDFNVSSPQKHVFHQEEVENQFQ